MISLHFSSASVARVPRPRGLQGGFSLLEVLVAFSILALVLTVLMQAFAGGLRMAGVTDDYGQAMLFAESKLAAVGTELKLTEGEKSGVYRGRYRWRVAMQRYTWGEKGVTDVLPIEPYHITVEVSWGDGRDSRSIALKTIRLAPKES